MSVVRRLIFPPFVGGRPAVGLLIFRIVLGTGMLLHGLTRLGMEGGMFGWLGDSVPGVLQAAAVVAEIGGGVALILGLLTPLAALGVIGTMFGAVWVVHWNDPLLLPGDAGRAKEPGILYMVSAVLLLFTGPGMLSLDAIFFRRSGGG